MIKYKKASELFLDKKIKMKYGWYLGCFGLLVCLYQVTRIEIDYIWVFMYISVVLLTYTQMGGDKADNRSEMINLFLILSCCDEVFFSILKGYFKISNISIPALYKLYMTAISSCCVYLILIFLTRLKNKVQKSLLRFKIQNKIQYTVFFMGVSILLTIALLEYSTNIIKNDSYQVVVVIFCILAYLAVEVLLLLSFYLKKSNFILEKKIIRNQKFYIMEKKYYELMLEREVETKKMRHDLHNHYICMETLLKHKDLEGAKEYLYQMSQKLNDIKKTSYFTGNKILDAITNYYAQMLPEYISLELSGKIYHDLKINNMDLCTIYSNIIENAVEELQKIKEQGYLKINIHSGNQYTEISVENSTHHKVETLYTSKKETMEHGIGLKNVQEVINRCNGRIQYEIKEYSFCVKVVI